MARLVRRVRHAVGQAPKAAMVRRPRTAAAPVAAAEQPRQRARPAPKTPTELARDTTAFTQRMINLTNQLKDMERQRDELVTLCANKINEIKALYLEVEGEKVGALEFAGKLYGYEETKSKAKTEYPMEAVLDLLNEMYDDEVEGLKKLLEISTTPAKELKLLFGENKLKGIAKTTSGEVTGKNFFCKPVKVK